MTRMTLEHMRRCACLYVSKNPCFPYVYVYKPIYIHTHICPGVHISISVFGWFCKLGFVFVGVLIVGVLIIRAPLFEVCIGGP